MTETFRILHTADWHICNEFMQDAERCTAFMIESAIDQPFPLDLIVIPGDIYNHRQIQQETESARLAFRTVRELARIAPVVVLTGTPSHDGQAPLMLDDIGNDFPVLVVDHPSQWVLYAGGGFACTFKSIVEESPAIPKAIISCTPAFTKQHFESGSDIATSNDEIARALGSIFAGFSVTVNEFHAENEGNAPLPHILLGHYSIGGAFIHPSQPMIGRDIEISRDHLAMANASINCLGHIHAAQVVNKNTFYSGSLFSTDFGEYEDKGFYIHKLQTFGHHWQPVKSDFIKTPSPTLVKLELDLVNTMVPDEMMLQYVIMAANEIPEDAKDAVVRLEVKVYQDKASFIDEKAVYEYFSERKLRSFKMDIVRLPRPNVRSATIMAAERLREKIQARAEIIGGDDILLSQTIMQKADDLQDTPPDVLLDHIEKSLRKENEPNETA